MLDYKTFTESKELKGVVDFDTAVIFAYRQGFDDRVNKRKLDKRWAEQAKFKEVFYPDHGRSGRGFIKTSIVQKMYEVGYAEGKGRNPKADVFKAVRTAKKLFPNEDD